MHLRPVILLPTAALAASLLAGCAAGGTSAPAPSLGGSAPSISGTVTAGPVCPVERIPPLPGCSPRPVGGAVVVVDDSSGREVARATTGTDGTYRVAVPATGMFTVSALPVQGLMRPPAPITVTLPAPGASATADLEYDTGIR